MALLFFGEDGEALGDEGFVSRDDLVEEAAALFREVETVGPALGTPLYETTLLHAVQQLRDVALRNEQGVGESLLHYAFLHSYVRQNVELGIVQPPTLPQLHPEVPLNPLHHPEQPHPRRHRRPPKASAPLKDLEPLTHRLEFRTKPSSRQQVLRHYTPDGGLTIYSLGLNCERIV